VLRVLRQRKRTKIISVLKNGRLVALAFEQLLLPALPPGSMIV